MSVTLKSRIPEITAELKVKLEQAAMTTAEAIAAEARANGRSSAKAKPHPGGAAVTAAWYYIFGEFGTVNEPARPTLTPAAEAARVLYQAEVRALLRTL